MLKMDSSSAPSKKIFFCGPFYLEQAKKKKKGKGKYKVKGHHVNRHKIGLVRGHHINYHAPILGDPFGLGGLLLALL